jgi:hypothetical protein
MGEEGIIAVDIGKKWLLGDIAPCEIGVGSAIKQSIPHMFPRMVSKTSGLINSFNLEPVRSPSL